VFSPFARFPRSCGGLQANNSYARQKEGDRMRLSRKEAIELCIELWTWLAKTGKRKWEWPRWDKYGEVENLCFFCKYRTQQFWRYPNLSLKNPEGFCRHCPLTSIGVFCMKSDSFYDIWFNAKTPETRKKYAKLFLKQIKTLRR